MSSVSSPLRQRRTLRPQSLGLPPPYRSRSRGRHGSRAACRSATEREALDTYAGYLIGANRYRHGRDVLIPAGHILPCEELRELWMFYGQTAPVCETVTATLKPQ